MAGQSVHVETVSPLASDEKENLLVCMLRLPEVFAAAKEKITVDHFDPGAELPYRVMWMGALQLVKDLGEHVLFGNPSKSRLLLETHCKSLAEMNPQLLTPGAWEQLFRNDSGGLFHFVYEQVLESDLEAPYAFQLLQRFLQERAQRQIARLLQTAGNRVLPNLAQQIQTITDQAQSVVGLSDDLFAPPAPEAWEPEKLELRELGIPFLDKFMRGGVADGEVYGIIGCTGVGKTTLALQIAACGARSEQAAELEAKLAGVSRQLRYWYVFHYEDGRAEMTRKLMVYAAEIHKDSMEDFDKKKNPFSITADPSTWKKYEKERWAKQLATAPHLFKAEAERLAEAKQWINRNVILVDMSCPPGAPRRGLGYVPEVATILQLGTQKGKPPGGVVLDYAGLMAKRYLNASGKDSSDLRHILGTMGDDCHRLIGAPFGCNVWVMHQLSGEANKFSPHKPQHHSDSAEAKNFAENMWFAFTIGTRHEESGCVLLNRSKSRRAPSVGRTYQLVKLDGAFGAFMTETGNWQHDGTQIINKGDNKLIASAVSEDKQAASPKDSSMTPPKGEASAYQDMI